MHFGETDKQKLHRAPLDMILKLATKPLLLIPWNTCAQNRLIYTGYLQGKG